MLINFPCYRRDRISCIENGRAQINEILKFTSFKFSGLQLPEVFFKISNCGSSNPGLEKKFFVYLISVCCATNYQQIQKASNIILQLDFSAREILNMQKMLSIKTFIIVCVNIEIVFINGPTHITCKFLKVVNGCCVSSLTQLDIIN